MEAILELKGGLPFTQKFCRFDAVSSHLSKTLILCE